jgi:hypothetical protein
MPSPRPPENTRDQAGRFQPGQSGNPGGRPKAEAEIRELAKDQTRRAMQRLIHLIDHAESEKVQVMAAVAILDRGWGRPFQSHEIKTTHSQPIYVYPPGTLPPPSSQDRLPLDPEDPDREVVL